MVQPYTAVGLSTRNYAMSKKSDLLEPSRPGSSRVWLQPSRLATLSSWTTCQPTKSPVYARSSR